jgi:glycerol-3-phosphate dehydrogenase (NAD(P)+)
VFGAGAMGTATAMHLARSTNDVVLWATPHDKGVLPSLTQERRHPALPALLPDALQVMGPDDLKRAADGAEISVMAAHSGGARSLARQVTDGAGAPSLILVVAKGLEPDTGKRMSEIYAEEAGHESVVIMGGPCLAPELAQELPTAVVMASAEAASMGTAAEAFETKTFRVTRTDDVAGVEYCSLAKNVASIGMGIVDGLSKTGAFEYRNAKAGLFAQGVRELAELAVALGGRLETAWGLAGLGDVMVTSLGGRNRLYGELIGEGAEAEEALADLTRRGMTVEGVPAAKHVRRLTEQAGLDLPFHSQVHRILFESAPAASLLEVIEAK